MGLPVPTELPSPTERGLQPEAGGWWSGFRFWLREGLEIVYALKPQFPTFPTLKYERLTCEGVLNCVTLWFQKSS